MAAAPAITFAWLLARDGAGGGRRPRGPARSHAGRRPRRRAPLPADAEQLDAGLLAQVWLVGVVPMVVRQFGGWRALRRIEHAPWVPLPAPWQQRFDVLRRAMGVSRSVSVRMAAARRLPFTAHVLATARLVPPAC